MLLYQFPHQISGVLILSMLCTHPRGCFNSPGTFSQSAQESSSTGPEGPSCPVLALYKSQGCSPKHRETVPSCQEFSSCGSKSAVGHWEELDLTLLNMAVFLMAWTSSGASGGSRYLSLVSSQFCLYKTWRENRWTMA